MRTNVRIPASRRIDRPGWVGSESDLEKLVGFFEDLRDEVQQSLDNSLELATADIRAEQDQYSSIIEGDRRIQETEENVQKFKDSCRNGIELSMSLAEEVRFPANDPYQVLREADVLATKAFSLDLTTDYKSREYAKNAAIRLDVRPSGVDCTITSSDRTFIEGTRARLEKLLDTTLPPRQWMVSPWFASLTSGAAVLALLASTLFFLTRFTTSTELELVTLFAVITAVVSFLTVTVHQVFWGRWRKNFPTVQVFRDGGKPLAERANRMLVKAATWTASVVVVPILLGVIFGD